MAQLVPHAARNHAAVTIPDATGQTSTATLTQGCVSAPVLIVEVEGVEAEAEEVEEEEEAATVVHGSAGSEI